MDSWLPRDDDEEDHRGFGAVRIKGVWDGSIYIKQGEVLYGHTLELIEDTAANGRQVIRQRGWNGDLRSHARSWWKEDVKIDYDKEAAGSCEGNWAPDLEACAICSIRERCRKVSLLKGLENENSHDTGEDI